MAAKVRRDGKGVYWVVAHHDGRRRKKRVGRDKRLAEEIARKIQARLVLGDFTMETEQQAPVPFRRFAQDWLRREVELPIERDLEGHHARGQGLVATNTVEAWKSGRPRRRSSSSVKVAPEKVLLDTYGHYLAEESRGFADVLSATSNGPPRGPCPGRAGRARRLRACNSAEFKASQ